MGTSGSTGAFLPLHPCLPHPLPRALCLELLLSSQATLCLCKMSDSCRGQAGGELPLFPEVKLSVIFFHCCVSSAIVKEGEVEGEGRRTSSVFLIFALSIAKTFSAPSPAMNWRIRAIPPLCFI